MSKSRRLRGTLVVVALAIVACNSSEPQESGRPVSVATEGTLHQEAQAYADAYGVSVGEADRRLRIQDTMDDRSRALQVILGEAWVNGWLEHAPKFRYVVVVVSDTAVDITAETDDWPLPVDVLPKPNFSHSELLAGVEAIAERLYRVSPDYGLYPDDKTGSIVINGPETLSPELLDELRAMAGVPVRFENTPPETVD